MVNESNIHEHMPDFIDASKLDCDYTATALNRFLRVDGILASSFIQKQVTLGRPISFRKEAANTSCGYKKLYKLSDVIKAAKDNGSEIQPTQLYEAKENIDSIKMEYENLLRDVEFLKYKKKQLLNEVDFMSGNLSDISPVLHSTGFCLVPISELVSKSSDYSNVCGIYFLIKDSKIVYIGQSRNIAARITAHKDKDFDSVSYVTCKKEELDITETLYILAYQPLLNGEVRAGGDGGYRPCTPISLEKINNIFSLKTGS